MQAKETWWNEMIVIQCGIDTHVSLFCWFVNLKTASRSLSKQNRASTLRKHKNRKLHERKLCATKNSKLEKKRKKNCMRKQLIKSCHVLIAFRDFILIRLSVNCAFAVRKYQRFARILQFSFIQNITFFCFLCLQVRKKMPQWKKVNWIVLFCVTLFCLVRGEWFFSI